MRGIAPVTVICGHYGCGKTNFTLNLALRLAQRGERVRVVDLDVVNPYFRSSDYDGLLARHGVGLIAPNMARTTLDTPSLSAAVDAALARPDGLVLVDAGGDDAGAAALGRFAPLLRGQAYEMLYVINRSRALVAEPQDAVEVLREIEAASHLTATGLVNNTHLAEYTDLRTVREGMEYAGRVSALCGLPVRFTCVPRAMEAQIPNAFAADVLVQKPWETPFEDEGSRAERSAGSR